MRFEESRNGREYLGVFCLVGFSFVFYIIMVSSILTRIHTFYRIFLFSAWRLMEKLLKKRIPLAIVVIIAIIIIKDDEEI